MIPSQTPPIPNLEVSDYVTNRQQARRRRQQRREQREELRRRQEAQQEALRRHQEAQRRQQQERRLRRREKNRRQYERRQERQQRRQQKLQEQQRERQQQREQEQKDRHERINKMRQFFNSFKQRIYRTYKENFFGAYDLQHMYATEWFKHRNVNDRETFPPHQQFEFLEDEIEQLRQIDAAQMLQDEEKEERNNQQLTYFEQSEALEFLNQQED